MRRGQPEFGERYGERVASAYDRMAEEYDFFDAATPFFVNDYRVTRAALEALRPRWEGRVVLDVGAGTGLQTAQFAPRARRVFALDLAGDLLRRRARRSRASAAATSPSSRETPRHCPLRMGAWTSSAATGM